jgi:hypothetical protein
MMTMERNMKIDIIITIGMIETGMILDLKPTRINIITGLDPIHTSHHHYLIDTHQLPLIRITRVTLTLTLTVKVIRVVSKCLINIICLIWVVSPSDVIGTDQDAGLIRCSLTLLFPLLGL